MAHVEASPAPTAAVAPNGATKTRLVSLDAFRGFTMAWIVGGKPTVMALAALLPAVVGGPLRTQLTHTAWAGLRFYDLIWPSFMLMVGVAIPFSFAKRAQTQNRVELILVAFRRAVVLFLLGSLRESLHLNEPVLIELSSALQPIALAYFVATLLAPYRMAVQATVAAAILVGYAALLAFVPAPGVVAGSYAKDANLVWYVDLAVLGRTLPEGWGTLLSAIPTVSTTILGVILGRTLMSPRSPRQKAAVMGGIGIGAILLGGALAPWIPVIMKLWTTSYGLVSAGWACLLLLAFYWIIDVQGWRRWAFPFVVVGSNAIAIYVGVSLVPFPKIVGVFTKPLAAGLGEWATFFNAAAVLLVEWLVLLWLYRRKIFIKA